MLTNMNVHGEAKDAVPRSVWSGLRTAAKSVSQSVQSIHDGQRRHLETGRARAGPVESYEDSIAVEAREPSVHPPVQRQRDHLEVTVIRN